MIQTQAIDVKPPPDQYDLTCETLIIGAGACGLVAALSAHETGQQVLVIEADPVPRGSTALSAGLIPAAGTSFQQGRHRRYSNALCARHPVQSQRRKRASSGGGAGRERSQ